jgi:signal transduction histidine kinase
MVAAEMSLTPAADAGDRGEVLLDYLEATARLQRTHETLQREIVRLRTELESKDRELERRRRLAALGELAAGVAHEVRNPLGAIQLYSGLLRNECGGLDPAVKLIEKIEAGIRAIDGVVRDTLALAPRGLRLAPCRLDTLVVATLDLCSEKLQSCGVQAITELANPATVVMIEEYGAQRVLMNLIVNAAEASNAGSEVRISAAEATDGRVELRVSDSGIGMPPEVLERIFDPFFTTKKTGTGLGLTLAHRLMEAQGGELRAANRAKGGAEFTMTLPVAMDGDLRARALNAEMQAA